ncbi:MAG TPA: efflux RND transporter periplasmic adaptor subunit [Xanthomonadaceae bacterium]|jgi:membrane fusion protein (multidrug efflux system)
MSRQQGIETPSAQSPGQARKPSTAKRMILMIVGVIVLIAAIAGIKVMMVMKMMAGMKPPPPAVVSTAKAAYADWQPDLRAVGSLRAARGADLAFDVAGLVTVVNVHSGDEVREGDVLVQLRDAEDVATLHQLQADANLADVTFQRWQKEAAVAAVARADLDQKQADLRIKQAAVAAQQVIVGKKQLRAPFAGRVGIVTINPGTYLNSGTTVVTVQQLDPMFVDFNLPQKDMGDLKAGQRVVVTLDAFPGKTFEGSLSAISPKVNADTRSVQIEAKVPNPGRVLAPGMFANVSVDVGGKQRYLTLPQTSVVYNPYGETVFVVKKKADMDREQAAQAAKNAGASPAGEASKAADSGPKLSPDALVVQQTFVTTGGTRGDQVAIVKGLDEGTEVVTSGQIKLKNGAPITVDNSVQPADASNPMPQEH